MCVALRCAVLCRPCDYTSVVPRCTCAEPGGGGASAGGTGTHGYTVTHPATALLTVCVSHGPANGGPGVPRRSPSPPCLPRLPTRWRPGHEPGLPSPSPRFDAPQECVEHLLPEATGFHPLSLALRFEEHIFPGFLRTVAGR